MDLTDLITLAIAVATAVAAAAAWRSARASRDASRAQVLLGFAERDASPEFGDATAALWSFRRERSDTPEEFSNRFEELRNTNIERWKEIDGARRIVHKYFIQLMLMKRAGLLSDKELLIAVRDHQLETVLEVLRPLESKKVGSPNTRALFDDYEALRRKRSIG